MFEHKTKPLISRQAYLRRLSKNFAIALVIIFISLFIGVMGYHFFCRLSWLDALLNASMILTGMGPVNVISGTSGKLFASAYALFSGIAFLTSIAFILSPAIHRLMHKFHLQDEE